MLTSDLLRPDVVAVATNPSRVRVATTQRSSSLWCVPNRRLARLCSGVTTRNTASSQTGTQASCRLYCYPTRILIIFPITLNIFYTLYIIFALRFSRGPSSRKVWGLIYTSQNPFIGQLFNDKSDCIPMLIPIRCTVRMTGLQLNREGNYSGLHPRSLPISESAGEICSTA